MVAYVEDEMDLTSLLTSYRNRHWGKYFNKKREWFLR